MVASDTFKTGIKSLSVSNFCKVCSPTSLCQTKGQVLAAKLNVPLHGDKLDSPRRVVRRLLRVTEPAKQHYGNSLRVKELWHKIITYNIKR
jgi:hypothetical protein